MKSRLLRRPASHGLFWTILTLVLLPATCASEPPDGFVDLFNGRDLTGWRENRFAHDPRWEVKDGVLVGRGGQGYLASTREFADFELEAEVRIADTGEARGNSGIYIRCQPHENRADEFPPGYEVQCDHADANNPTGSVYNLGVPGARAPLPRIKDGEWFALRVLAQGSHLRTWVNGDRGADCRDPQNRYRKGYILLQMHHRTGVVEFRKVRARELPAGDRSLLPRAGGAEPRAWLEPAPIYRFPASPDCNSPSFWSGGLLHLFTSNQHPSRSSGPDLARLGQPTPCLFEDGAKKLRWIEAVHLREDGVLFGLYHREEYLGECPNREYFTVPDIGVARSTDLGRTWRDLGIVLQDQGVKRSCETPNKFFAGGVGDPSWAVDRARGWAYIFFSSYTDPVSNQGVQIARLPLADLDSPVGKVRRWHEGHWTAPGVGGAGTPIVPARIAWSDPKADAFWGPSVHWNTYLGTHVVLVNRASDANWTQEGVYVFFAPDLSKPDSFTTPRKIRDGGEWYAQVVGDTDIHGTDSLVGKSARFFQHGTSEFRIVFERPTDSPETARQLRP